MKMNYTTQVIIAVNISNKTKINLLRCTVMPGACIFHAFELQYAAHNRSTGSVVYKAYLLIPQSLL
jgi:hypothetical protein